MNKVLLIWNLVLTVLVIGVFLTGCASMDPQFTYLSSKVDRNSEAIDQLAEAANENRRLIQEQALQNKAWQLTIEARLQ